MIYLLACFTILAAATPAEIAIAKQSAPTNEVSEEEIERQRVRQMLNRMPFKEINQLSEVLSDGLLIVFNDLSKWEVESQDTLYTSAWLLPVKIKMERVDDPDNYEFPFFMTNLATKTTVHARRIQ